MLNLQEIINHLSTPEVSFREIRHELEDWLKDPQNTIDSETYIESILPLIPKEYKLEVIAAWFEKPNTQCNADALVKILPFAGDEPAQVLLIKKWLDLPKTECKQDSFITILSFIKRAHEIPELIKKWLDLPKTECTGDFLVKFLPLIREYLKKQVVDEVLSHPKTVCNATSFVTISSMIGYHLKEDLLYKWLDMPTTVCDADEIIMILPLCETEKHKEYLVWMWLEKLKKLNSVCSADTFVRILALISDRYCKTRLVDAWLSKFPDINSRLQGFISITRTRGIDTYDYPNIYRDFASRGFSSEQVIELCKGLYAGSEYAQTDFVNTFIKKSSMSNYALRLLITKFASSLSEDDLCLEVVERGMLNGLQPLDVILIARNRLSSKFASLADLLNVPLRDALIAGGWEDLKNQFGTLPQEAFTLLALFSYYDINKQMTAFNKLVKPDILEAIKTKFTPPSTSPFIMRDEHDKLRGLGIAALPDMSMLCLYLKQKVPALPSIDESMTKMDAQLAAYENDKTKTEKEDKPEIAYKKRFKALIAAGDAVTKADIFDFFKTVTGLPLAEEDDKLFNLFSKRMQALAWLFSQKDGISDYIMIIRDIGHGCAANIGTKTNLYILGKLLKDPEDQVLYSLFSEKIVVPILNRGQEDRLGSNVEGVDIFADRHVLGSHISIPGLISALSAEFYFNSQMKSNASDLIKKLLPAKEFRQFYDNLDDIYEEDTTSALSKEAEMASYLILRKTLPELLKDRFCHEFTNEMESWLSNKPQPRKKLSKT